MTKSFCSFLSKYVCWLFYNVYRIWVSIPECHIVNGMLKNDLTGAKWPQTPLGLLCHRLHCVNEMSLGYNGYKWIFFTIVWIESTWTDINLKLISSLNILVYLSSSTKEQTRNLQSLLHLLTCWRSKSEPRDLFMSILIQPESFVPTWDCFISVAGRRGWFNRYNGKHNHI